MAKKKQLKIGTLLSLLTLTIISYHPDTYLFLYFLALPSLLSPEIFLLHWCTMLDLTLHFLCWVNDKCHTNFWQIFYCICSIESSGILEICTCVGVPKLLDYFVIILYSVCVVIKAPPTLTSNSTWWQVHCQVYAKFNRSNSHLVSLVPRPLPELMPLPTYKLRYLPQQCSL